MKNVKINMQVSARILVLLFLSAWLGSMAAWADDLIVLKGSSVRIPVAQGIQKISIGSPSIIDARPSDDGQSVVVSGLSEGNSELRIQLLQGAELVTNVVVRSDLNQMQDQIKELLSDVEGLEIETVGDKIILKGNIVTKADYDKVSKVVEAYSGVILNMSTFDRSGMNQYVEEAILQDIGLSSNNISVHVMGDTVILEGVVYSQADADRAVEMAKLRMPNVKSLLRVQDVMVETDVQFVQASIDNSKDMGYNVLDTLSASLSGSGTSTGGGLPISFGVTGSIRIKALIGNGNMKIVASPHLSTKSGEAGNFQSGGTKYFAVPSTVGPSSLQSVDYGVILKVKPTLQGRDQILNEVTIEVSTPVPDPSGVLTLQKYSTTCTSLCKVGESMVLSGMVQQMTSGNSSKTPLLGDVPLLDLFFSNKTSDKSRNEFVIVVTPQPVFPTESTDKPYGEEHGQLLQQNDGKE